MHYQQQHKLSKQPTARVVNAQHGYTIVKTKGVKHNTWSNGMEQGVQNGMMQIWSSTMEEKHISTSISRNNQDKTECKYMH